MIKADKSIGLGGTSRKFQPTLHFTIARVWVVVTQYMEALPPTHTRAKVKVHPRTEILGVYLNHCMIWVGTVLEEGLHMQVTNCACICEWVGQYHFAYMGGSVPLYQYGWAGG